MPTGEHRLGAASVIGKEHALSGMPNQDAYRVKKYSFGTVLVAADGLGSRPRADFGSNAACTAVCEAAKLWGRQPAAPVELLIRLIHSLWEVEVSSVPREDCATTCLFAVVFDNGRLACGQLGDGIVGYERADGAFRIVSDKEDDFTNVTQSLHSARSLGDWKWIEEETGSGPLSLLLATDGISEDLIPDKRQAFLNYLGELTAQADDFRRRNAAVRRLLAGWTAKHSNDDKTLIAFHRGAKP